MKALITVAHYVELMNNGTAAARGEVYDPLPVVKLFTPDAPAVWLLTELNPVDGDTVFGLYDLGQKMPELRYFRISELENIRGPQNQPVKRDPHFTPKRPLSEYLRLAKARGVIDD